MSRTTRRFNKTVIADPSHYTIVDGKIYDTHMATFADYSRYLMRIGRMHIENDHDIERACRHYNKSKVESGKLSAQSSKWIRRQTNRQERRHNKIAMVESIRSDNIDEYVDPRHHLPWD